MTKITKNSNVLIKDSRELWNNKTGIVISNIIDDSSDQYIKVKVNLGDNKNVIETFLLSDLELILSDEDLALENLNESVNLKSTAEKLDENIESSQLTDIIKPYLIDEFGNDTWFNVNKIAQAECLSTDQVMYIAKTLGYNIYKIYTKHKTFKIIAPKSMKDVEFIRDNFGAYLSGFIRTEKL